MEAGHGNRQSAVLSGGPPLLNFQNESENDIFYLWKQQLTDLRWMHLRPLLRVLCAARSAA